jgi:hypothetical protein
MNSERAPARQLAPSPAPNAPRKPVHENVDQAVPWYGRLLIAGVLIGATVEFFRLLLAAIVLH